MNGYQTHARRIAGAFYAEPLQVFPAVAKFVLATIQQQFHTVGSILDEWDERGIEAESCWGMKRDGLAFLEEPTSWKPVALELLRAANENDRELGIDTLIAIPGINTVKAAFICQLVGLETACLDTQNLKRLGIENVRAFYITPTNTAKTRTAKIRAYLKLCDELGSSESFWNIWCEQIAQIYPQHFDTDWDVSSFHVEQTLRRVDHSGDNEVPF